MKLKEFLATILSHSAQTQIDVAEIKKDLSYHIRRTDLLEERIDAETARIHKRYDPVVRTHTFIRTLLVVVSKLAVIGAAMAAIVKIF